MNLHDISIEQITMFCNMFNCSLEEFKPSFNDSYYLKMFTGSMGPQPEFRVTETSCKGINYYKGLGYRYFKISKEKQIGFLVIKEYEEEVYLDKIYFDLKCKIQWIKFLDKIEKSNTNNL